MQGLHGLLAHGYPWLLSIMDHMDLENWRTMNPKPTDFSNFQYLVFFVFFGDMHR